MGDFFSKTHVDVLRHGKCEGGHIFRGSNDVALSPEGLKQMFNSGEQLVLDWDLVISSPLIRCRGFAEAFCDKHKLPLRIDKRLREMSFGDWEGKFIDAIWQSDSERLSAWSQNPTSTTPPNGEPLDQVQERIQHLLRDIQTEHIGKKILLVTHGGVIRVLLSSLLNMPLANANRFDVPYACVSQFAFYFYKPKYSNNINPPNKENTESTTSTNTKNELDNITIKLLTHNLIQ